MFSISEEEAMQIALSGTGIVSCELCGATIAELKDGHLEKRDFKPLKQDISSIQTTTDESVMKKYEQNPIGRIHLDHDFSMEFKQDFLLFFARIIHYVLKELEQKRGSSIDHWTLDDALLTEIVDNANPVLYNLTRNLFLQKLKYVGRAEFEQELEKFLHKAREIPQFHEDFLIYLRWISKEVFLVVSKLWNQHDLPKFEQTIRDDLKSSNLQRPVIRQTRWISMNYDDDGMPLSIGQKLDKALELFKSEVLSVLQEDPELRTQMEERKFLGVNDLGKHGFNGFLNALSRSPDNKISWNDFKKFAGFTGSKTYLDEKNSYTFISYDEKGEPLSREEKILKAITFYNEQILPELLEIPSIKQKVEEGKKIVTRDLTLNGYSGFLHALTKTGNKMSWNEFREEIGLELSIDHNKYRFLNYDDNGNPLTRNEKMKIAVNYFVSEILPEIIKDPVIKEKINQGKAPTVIDIQESHQGFNDPLTKRGHRISHNELMRELGFITNVDHDKYRAINYKKNGEFLTRKEKLTKAREFFLKKIIPALIRKKIIAPGETPSEEDISKGGFSGFYPNLSFKGEQITYNEFLTEINMELNLEQGKWNFMKYDLKGNLLSLEMKVEKCAEYLIKEIYPDLLKKKILNDGETPTTFDFIDGGHYDFLTAFQQKEPQGRIQDLLITAGFELKSPQDHDKWKFFYDDKGNSFGIKKQYELAVKYFKKEIVENFQKKGLLSKERAPDLEMLKKYGHYDFYKAIYRRNLSYFKIIEESGLNPNFRDRLAAIGNNFHWIAEKIFLINAKNNDCTAFYEVKKNSDNSILVNLNFQNLSALADIFSALKPDVKIINFDYYLSDNYSSALNHATRGYQGKKRALILVPVHAKKSRAFMADDIDDYNVTIMDPLRFTQFIGYDDELKDEFIESVQLAKSAIYNDKAFNELHKRAIASRVYIKDPTKKVNISTRQFEKVKSKFKLDF